MRSSATLSEKDKLWVKQNMPKFKDMIDKAYDSLQAEYRDYLEAGYAMGNTETMDFPTWCGTWLEMRGCGDWLEVSDE